MAPKLAAPDDNQVRLYDENVAAVLLSGISLPEINRSDWPATSHPAEPTEFDT
jgi:hypothetical protein